MCVGFVNTRNINREFVHFLLHMWLFDRISGEGQEEASSAPTICVLQSSIFRSVALVIYS